MGRVDVALGALVVAAPVRAAPRPEPGFHSAVVHTPAHRSRYRSLAVATACRSVRATPRVNVALRREPFLGRAPGEVRAQSVGARPGFHPSADFTKEAAALIPASLGWYDVRPEAGLYFSTHGVAAQASWPWLAVAKRTRVAPVRFAVSM